VKKKTVTVKKVVKDDVDTGDQKNTNARRSSRKRVKVEEQVVDEQIVEVSKPAKKRKSVATKVKIEDSPPKKRTSRRSGR
jgi:hypothetical protein